jgi:arylsulfatase A-like enzyme
MASPLTGRGASECLGSVPSALLAALLALLACAACAQEPPDVLLIAVDDLNDWIGPLGGHPQVQTPNIDRLAAAGMTFTNAQSPSAICNASRTAFLTGLRPSTSGVYGNAPDWRTMPRFDGIATLPRYFRDHGYRTLGAGKIFHAHTFASGGFAGYNDTTAWDAFWPAVNRQLPDELAPVAKPVNRNPLFPGFDWAGLVADDSALGDGQVVGWIGRQLIAETGAPRFVAAGIYRPHLPWYVPQKYFDLYPLESVVLPDVLASDLDDVPAVAARGSFQSRELHEWVVEQQVWKDAVRGYLASISYADAMIGRLLDALQQSGRADRTIIVLLGDHGFHLGEKLRWRKMTLWEESTHVPLIVVAPGVTRPGSRSGEAVSLMDVFPTLAELAGLDAPAYVEGESLTPLLRDPDAKREAPAISTYGFGNHAVRDERYRFIRYADGSEELYDHVQDPNEWRNLAGQADYASVIAELSRWLPAENAPDGAARRPRAAAAESGP